MRRSPQWNNYYYWAQRHQRQQQQDPPWTQGQAMTTSLFPVKVEIYGHSVRRSL